MAFEECIEETKSQLAANLPFVLYRKPDETSGKAIYQDDDRVVAVQDFLERGFVIAPFDYNEDAILLRPDRVVEWTHEPGRDKVHLNEDGISLDDTGKVSHINLVEKGIEQILTGKLEKVVLSRSITHSYRHSPFILFQGLLESCPNAFCYLWYHPRVGMWLGASPEALLKLDQDQLSSMSLAGTKAYMEGKNPGWEDKELREQEIVTQYILEVLEPYLTELSREPMSTERAGNLWHLRTMIKGRLRSSGLQKIIEVLHPTPAICGFPLREAKDFIRAFEDYDREYYTGFLGELNLEAGVTNLYVNLRCMQLKGQMATIYVGGGITKDSDSEKEWEETRLKSETMLRVLQASKE